MKLLKLSRYKQWVDVLRDADLSLSQWLGLLWIPFSERLSSKREWTHRMSQCVRCPIYDPRNRTCMICSCHMPIKAMFADQSCAGTDDGIPVARGWLTEGERKTNSERLKADAAEVSRESMIGKGIDATVKRRPLSMVAKVLNNEEENKDG